MFLQWHVDEAIDNQVGAMSKLDKVVRATCSRLFAASFSLACFALLLASTLVTRCPKIRIPPLVPHDRERGSRAGPIAQKDRQRDGLRPKDPMRSAWTKTPAALRPPITTAFSI